MIRRIVWNTEEDRLRAPWRLFVALVVGVVVLAGVSVGLVLTLGIDPTDPLEQAGLLERAALVLAPGAVIVLVVAGAGRFLDRRRFEDFGFRIDGMWWRDLLFGLVLGAALMTLVFAIEVGLGWLTITGVGAIRDVDFLLRFGLGVAIFLAVGVYEELFARGYLLTNIAEGLSGYSRTLAVVVATLASSAVFGVLHAGNPNATALSTVAISLAGVMLAVGYVVTGELAIPIGIHVTWNTFQGLVYGFPVSGADVGASLLSVQQAGPARFTGGAFGPEAGLLGIGAIVLGTVVVVVWTRFTNGFGIDREVTRPTLRRRVPADD